MGQQGRARPDTVLAEPAPRGRPRSARAHEAILQAAVGLLLEHGLDAVSMDAVAARAGVSKATIYRWWPTKESLALDALYTEWSAAAPDPRDTGSLRGDLIELLSPWARLVGGQRPYARVIAALLAETHTDPAFAAEYQQRVVQPRRDQARAIFARAIERGEISPGLDLEVALDLIYGPLYHRLLQGHAPLDDAFVKSAVDMALGGIESPAAAGQRDQAARAAREPSRARSGERSSLSRTEAGDSHPRTPSPPAGGRRRAQAARVCWSARRSTRSSMTPRMTARLVRLPPLPSRFASGVAADRPSPSSRRVSGWAAISRAESIARSRPSRPCLVPTQ